MFAALDKENLVHGHQTAAASKPQNQTVKHLPPKTPGNQVPKTPFKIPLNDENGPPRFGKLGLEANSRGNENPTTGGGKGGFLQKNAFITPLGPRNRAPLGQKTTNAKAKVFRTPAPPLPNEVKKEEPRNEATVKAKPTISHAEMTNLDALMDIADPLDLEPEYMPPRAKDMPDYPDDMPHELDFSMFKNGGTTRNFLQHFATRIGDDGLSHMEREAKQRQKDAEIADKKADALLLREFESMHMPCVHDPECIDMECTINLENRKAAEQKYQATLAALSTSPPKPQNPVPVKKPAQPRAPPSTLTSKSAAAALSISKPDKIPNKKLAIIKSSSSIPFSSKPSTSILSRKRRDPVPQPSNPSSMHHAALAATSKTTIGRSKGRVTSAALKKATLPPPSSSSSSSSNSSSNAIKSATADKTLKRQQQQRDHTLAPQIYIERYGVPIIGSEMWIRCKTAGCFDEPESSSEREEEGRSRITALEDLFRQEAERDFELVF